MTKTLGHVTLKNEINGHIVTSQFYVMQVGTTEDQKVLQRTWCYQINYQVDWRQWTTTLTKNGRTSMVELLKMDDHAKVDLKEEVILPHKIAKVSNYPQILTPTRKIWIQKSLVQRKEEVLWILKRRNKPHHQTTPLLTQGPNNCQPYQDR